MAIRSLLERASLARLVPLFEDEELTVSLLVSMGGALRSNLEELGLTLDEVEAIAEALLHGEMDVEVHVKTPASAREVESVGFVVVPHVSVEYRERVALLQAELFSEDLEPPAGAEQWSEAELRAFFESGGESCPPSGSAASAPAAAESAATILSSPALPAPTAEPPAAEAPTASGLRVDGPIIGTLRVRWQGHTAEFGFAAGTTVGTLRLWLQHKTGVHPARQKLLGFTRQRAGQGGRAGVGDGVGGGSGGGGSGGVDDDTLLCAVQPAPGKAVTMVGTPDADLEAAERELEMGRRGARLVHNDLRSASESPEAAAAARARGAAAEHRPRPRPQQQNVAIQPQRGGGVWLDPALWAAAEPPAEGVGVGSYRTNPYTGRRERLELSNALHGHGGVRRGGGGGGAAADVPAAALAELEEPPNVDHMGQARGGCMGCSRCTGFERLRVGERPLPGGTVANAADLEAEAPPWAENDINVLRCRVCNCFSSQHEAI